MGAEGKGGRTTMLYLEYIIYRAQDKKEKWTRGQGGGRGARDLRLFG